MFLAKFQIELLSPWAVGAVQSFGCEMSSLFCAQLDEGRVLDVLLFLVLEILMNCFLFCSLNLWFWNLNFWINRRNMLFAKLLRVILP